MLVTNAIDACSWLHKDSVWAQAGLLGGGWDYLPPYNASLGLC